MRPASWNLTPVQLVRYVGPDGNFLAPSLYRITDSARGARQKTLPNQPSLSLGLCRDIRGRAL